nr:PREDICTED: cytosolic endo-beta-N-acetylglucosaminidase [Bemisia tabaci]XP_018911537.1 PREDICTED: cytosolic endo-beta-N-acetylglucosaminidase [Bemisia tabaci]
MSCNKIVDLMCGPIKNLEDLFCWQVPELSWAENVINLKSKTFFSYAGKDWSCKDVPPTNVSKYYSESVPKTLLCHDMKGGYLNDRFVNGAASCDDYKFIHWSGIDIFVYFSHEFITVPPLAWINAGHRHGVPVLGTLITEGKQGEDLWETVLASEEKVQSLISKMNAVCNHYRFDGYLLNIENKINPAKMTSLVTFVSRLKNSLGTDKLVIWYDSVTHPEGKLDWQNELNFLNRAFFEACDGIYLNYGWNEDKLRASISRAGARVTDVFVGVDVFGRGCYGGGEFNSVVAVAKARELNLSIAIFAPAWTHECQNESLDYVQREMKFWEMLWPYLYLHGPASLPFSTSFCQGVGRKTFLEGEALTDSPWYNLAKQEYQLTKPSCIEDVGCNPDIKRCFHYTNQCAYKGGCCLLFAKHTGVNTYRLFMCGFVNDGTVSLKMIFAVKPIDATKKIDYNLVLTVSDSLGPTSELKNNSRRSSRSKNLVLRNSEFLANEEDYSAIIVNSESLKVINNWNINQYRFNYRGILTDISMVVPENCEPFMIGLLQIEKNQFIIADNYF